MLVCPCHFWRTTTWMRQQGHVRPLIWAFYLARSCQVATSYRVNTWWAGHINHKAWVWASPLQNNYMLYIWHPWTTIRRGCESSMMQQQQQKRMLQIQTPTKPRRQQNLGLCVHSVWWHTSSMLSVIMYMQFGCLGCLMGLPCKRYMSFGYCMPLVAYQWQVGTSPTQMVLPTCPQRPVHTWNHETAASWVNTISDVWACTAAKLLDRKKVKIWWHAGW